MELSINNKEHKRKVSFLTVSQWHAENSKPEVNSQVQVLPLISGQRAVL